MQHYEFLQPINFNCSYALMQIIPPTTWIQQPSRIHKWIVLNDVSALQCVPNFRLVPKNLVFSMLCMVMIWHFVFCEMLRKIYEQLIQFYLNIFGAESMKLNMEVSNSNITLVYCLHWVHLHFMSNIIVVFINLSSVCWKPSLQLMLL